MAVSIQLNKFVLGRDRDFALEFLQLAQKYKAIDICNTLLVAVESEQLSPLVFRIFLRTTKSIECIVSCLRQSISDIIRKESIKQYGKALQDVKRWKEAWHYLGDVEGILDYLSMVSVNDVKFFCKIVGRCNYRRSKSQERSDAVQELLKAMNPSLFQDVLVKTPDKRPLGIHASHMLAACSPDFVKSLIQEGDKHPLYAACSKGKLVKAYRPIVYDHTKSVIFKIKTPVFPQDIRLFLSRFVCNEPSLPGKEKHFSASMEFSERLLEERIRNPESIWPHQPTESEIYSGLLNRCVRKRVTKKRLHGIIDLGIRLINSNPKLKNTFYTKNLSLWDRISRYWAKWPEYWEDLLIAGLKLGLAGSSGLPNTFESFISSVEIKPEATKSDRIWTALRLFCLYVPKHGVDINTAEALKSLAKLKWNISIFEQLPEDKAIRLLKLLIKSNNKSDFLSCSDPQSILKLSSLRGRHNLNALLYLTQLQIDSQDESQRNEGLERAIENCADYKNKCITSKEQQDRAQYARAMGLFAVASGSLELYEDYVAWLARFIRDPLTIKVIFNRDNVASGDVSDLLSGIPKRMTEPIELSSVSENVSKANAILMKFHEHHKTAKREPSYQTYDWHSVSELVAETIRKRIDRAKSLQKHLNISQGELYSQIWSQTFSVYSQSGAKSMELARNSISNLLTSLPPKLLVNVTKSLLEIDNKYRAAKADGKEAEDESAVIGQLVLDCLQALASGDNPTLAGELIVHFVIARPDASSWHRELLKIGFFKSLPAKYAQQLLLNFSQIIGEKLEEQSYVRVGEATTAPSIVKVTTVKYLAQILQDAEFLSAESSIDVLLELFKVATHPDIRLATLESMLSTLQKLATSEMNKSVVNISDSENPLIKKILAALDAVVPIIGSINERRPPTEQEWRDAEKDTSLLPDPSPGLNDRPLWRRLVNAANSSKSLQGYFVARLLLPGLQRSILAHRKWLTLFLKKYRAGFNIDQLPATIPATLFMMDHMNNHFLQYVPKELFNGWVQYTRFLQNHPASLDNFIFKLEKDEKISDKPDVLHFVSMFGNCNDSALHWGAFKFIDLIHHSWQTSVLPGNKGVSVVQVQEAILDQMRTILLKYDQNVKNWDIFLNKLKHPTASIEEWRKWKDQCQPLLTSVVKMINDLRTPQWYKDPHRKPIVLPTTIRPRLWSLEYPIPKMSTEMADAQTASLGRSLLDILSDLLRTELSVIKVKKLKADVMTISERISDRERIQIGLILGTFNRIDTVDESVRVSLAIEFLDKGRQAFKNSPLKVDVADMLQCWRRSSVEDVREMVLDLSNIPMSGSLWRTVLGKDETVQ